jgi:hypothetical protein
VAQNENAVEAPGPRRLGRLPRKSTRKALLFTDFFKFIDVPKKQEYWKKKSALPLRSFGNLEYGDCTRASQANAILRLERIEQRRLVEITDEEVISRYLDMTERLYGGGDTGAYEDDALNEWRNPETTIRDTKENPFTIDAYLGIDPNNHDEIRTALALSGAHGIKICLNLPAAFARIDPPATWDVPSGQPLTGEWMPGSWGGHSLFAHGFNSQGIVLDHTWALPNSLLTWEAAAAYLDEAHLIIDSIDTWRKKAATPKIKKALGQVVDAVNAVSSVRIKI